MASIHSACLPSEATAAAEVRPCAPEIAQYLVYQPGGAPSKISSLGSTLRGANQHARQQPLIQQHAVAQQACRDARLDLQVHRHAPADESDYAIASTNTRH